jgi:hypothetical protein
VEAFGRRADDAAESLIRALQRALSCVTPAVLIKEFAAPRQPHVATTGRASVRLPGAQPLGFSVLVAYDLAPTDHPGHTSWTARIVGYAYELRSVDDRMILAFHWHPVGYSPVTWPHLHLGATIAGIDLGKAHVPAGAVTLQEVIRFAIVDGGARPRRDDWDEVLMQRSGEIRP